MQTNRTLRPGYLVSLKTSIDGGPKYTHSELDHTTQDGVDLAKWETMRTIEDKAEYEAAIKVRSACRCAVIRTCCQSDFGLLCPTGRSEELIGAIDTAHKLASEFNATAKICHVNVYAITARIADNDQEAMRAIGAEIRNLMQDMQEGIKAVNVEAIRTAAGKAKALGGMLTEEASASVNAAIEQARANAREIVKRVNTAGETAALVVTQLKVDAIESARFAFLDLDDNKKEVQAAPIAPRAVELLQDFALETTAVDIPVHPVQVLEV